MIKFAGNSSGKFFYMAINRTVPVGRVQKKILSMVEVLDNCGTPLQEIYDAVCVKLPWTRTLLYLGIFSAREHVA